MEKVAVEIDATWVKISRSPLYWIVVSLQGVSITFAPLFLFWSGRGMFGREYEWVVVPTCFALIFLVPLFYFRLGGAVISQLRKSTARE